MPLSPNTCQAWITWSRGFVENSTARPRAIKKTRASFGGRYRNLRQGKSKHQEPDVRRQGTDNTRPALTNLPSDAVVRHGSTDQDAKIVPRPDTWSERNFSMPIRRPSDPGEFSAERLPRAEVVDCVVFIGLVWDIGQLIRPGLNNRIRCFRSYLFCLKSSANASSNSGCVGGSVEEGPRG